MDDANPNSKKGVTNPPVDSDKPFVSDVKLLPPDRHFSDTWKISCREILNKYIAYRDAKQINKYRPADLHREIMAPHHQRDEHGRIEAEENRLTRQDLANFLSGHSMLKPWKFRYVDYFVRSREIWNHPVFAELRDAYVEEEQEHEAKNLFSAIVSNTNQPNPELEDWEAEYIPVQSGLQNLLLGRNWVDKCVPIYSSFFPLFAHIKSRQGVKYVKCLFVNYGDLFDIVEVDKNEAKIQTKEYISPDFILSEGIVLSGYLTPLERRADGDELGPESSYEQFNMTLYSRLTASVNITSLDHLNMISMPYVSFFVSMLNCSRRYPEGHFFDLEIAPDQNRMPIGIAPDFEDIPIQRTFFRLRSSTSPTSLFARDHFDAITNQAVLKHLKNFVELSIIC